MDDLIRRQAALEKVRTMQTYKLFMGDDMILVDKAEVQTELMMLPSVQPAQHGRIFQEIVVEYPSISTYSEHEGKPYFSIKYTENGQEFIGYGTYNPEVLSEYLKEYFMPSAQPKHKKGRWLPDNRPGGGFWVCSECKFPSEAFAANVLYKFCPNCGAKMKGETT